MSCFTSDLIICANFLYIVALCLIIYLLTLLAVGCCRGFVTVGTVGRRYRSIAAQLVLSSKFGQCHVVSWHRKPNTGLSYSASVMCAVIVSVDLHLAVWHDRRRSASTRQVQQALLTLASRTFLVAMNLNCRKLLPQLVPAPLQLMLATRHSSCTRVVSVSYWHVVFSKTVYVILYSVRKKTIPNINCYNLNRTCRFVWNFTHTNCETDQQELAYYFKGIYDISFISI